MMKIILYGLLIWFLYNLVFRFIIPVYRTTRQVRKKFREMQDRMQDQQGFNAGAGTNGYTDARSRPSKPQPKGDYIDFEEIR